MDESLRHLEERLEKLIPKGISDHGRGRLEQTVEELATTTVKDEAGGHRWKWGIGLAAGLALIAGAELLREPAAEPVVTAGMVPTVPEAASQEDEEAGPALETMASSRQIAGRIDEGLVETDGSPHLYRYWGYEVTDEEEILDQESGYVVRIVTEREERIPVRMTSL